MRDWNLLLVCITHAVFLCFTQGSLSLDVRENNTTGNFNKNGTLLTPHSPSHSLTKRDASQPSKPINPERKKLLRDALSWLTLRSNGNLLSPSELQPFYDMIITQYSKSKFYRSYVIAFQHGVLPKLTLNANDDCDPSFMKAYRDPYNNSFTYYYQKQFVFDNFKKQDEEEEEIEIRRKRDALSLPSAYCDYRQGLICHPVTKKCECQEGGKMESLQTSPPIERCVMQPNAVCALADLTHDQTHEDFKMRIHSLIFNLEKPISCMSGTVCRIGVKDGGIFKCHDASSNQWASPTTKLSYLDECTVNVYGTPEMCAAESEGKPYMCYDYGPRAKPVVNRAGARTGFCSRQYGSAVPRFLGGQTTVNGILDQTDPFILSYVSPRTVPFRGDRLRDYQYKVFESTHRNFIVLYPYPTRQGEGCSMARTKQLENIFEFYASLENDPPPGEDFVATETQLNSKLAELQSVLNGDYYGSGMCKIWWEINKYGWKFAPSACVSTGAAPDKIGNDGTCQNSTSNLTRPYAENLRAQFNQMQRANENVRNEEFTVDTNILIDHRDPPPCSTRYPPQGPPSEEYQDHQHFDFLTNNVCPAGSVCYEDFHDSHGMYKRLGWGECQFSDGFEPQFVCHSNSIRLQLEKCERKRLEKKLIEAENNFHEYSKLDRGAYCDYKAESIVRADASNWNRHNPYVYLSMVDSGLSKGGFCDATKLLTCTQANKCECFSGTAPRASIKDWKIKSDYCYKQSGSCGYDMTSLIPLTKKEASQVRDHYSPASDCADSNVCVVADRRMCTDGDWNNQPNTQQRHPSFSTAVQEKYTKLIIMLIIIPNLQLLQFI